MKSTTEKSGASDEEQVQARDVVHEFYELLPFQEVNDFNAETASEEDIAEMKACIDEAQAKFEQVESMRIPLDKDFTAEELTDTERFPYRTLQRIAKQNGISAAQTRACLESSLTGIPKSLPAIGRYGGSLVKRLALARKNVGGYVHPRTTAARRS